MEVGNLFDRVGVGLNESVLVFLREWGGVTKSREVGLTDRVGMEII